MVFDYNSPTVINTYKEISCVRNVDLRLIYPANRVSYKLDATPFTDRDRGSVDAHGDNPLYRSPTLPSVGL